MFDLSSPDHLPTPDAAPLFDRVRRHVRRRPVQFHIPGHKRGAGADPPFADYLGANALALDQINIEPLDDCHSPRGVIAEAQRLAAAAFGAEHTFFSVQGTSTPLMAMIMAACGPGEKLIVPRNAHKSVMAGIILSGAKPVFVLPEIGPDGCVGNVAPAAYERALAEHPDAKAVLAIHPTYYGACTDLPRVAAAAHKRGLPVLVDEAHGAQFYFHPDFPPSAMAAGADAAAVSMHKTGGSLTQSSLLNIQGPRMCHRRVQVMLNVLTTTSTSYLLLASLDAARRHMQLHGKQLLDRALAAADEARARINAIPGLRCRGFRFDGEAHAWDRTKLCIDVRGLGLNGRRVEHLLRRDHNIEVEFSDLHHVLCLFSAADDGAAVDVLVRALAVVASSCTAAATPESRRKSRALDEGQVAASRDTATGGTRASVPPTAPLTPREAFFTPTEVLPLREAEGRVSAEFLTAYPPGIPAVVPGEVVTAAAIAEVLRHKSLGYPVHGPEDGTLDTLRVVSRSSL